MLNSEKIVKSISNAKKEKFGLFCDFVNFRVRTYERENAYNAISGTLEDMEKEMTSTHPENKDFSAMYCNDETATELLTGMKKDVVEIASFIRTRSNVVELDKELATIPVKQSDYDALKDVDRVFVTLQAHTAMPGIKLDESILKDYDFADIVAKHYKNGTMKAGKDALKGVFHKLLANEGVLVYGVKLKKSNFNDEIVRDFFASFRGGATRRVTKTKDGQTVYGSFEYKNAENSKKVQIAALTRFLAVVLDRKNDYGIVRPADSEENAAK